MKFMHTAAVAAAVTLAASLATAQVQRGESKATIAGKSIAVEYGRPVLGGRDMLGQAQVGMPWRMGADAATSLTTAADLTFGSETVPKGAYVLSAVKGEDGSWTVVVSSTEGDRKVAQIPLTSATLQESVEQFTIEVTAKGSAGEFAMMWGKAKMSAPFTGK